MKITAPTIVRVLFSVLMIVCNSSPLPCDPSPKPSSVTGVITHRISGCDYFVVVTKTGYDVLEWYGGHDPDRGDTLVGNFESYGFHDILDDTVDESIHIYTEDYYLSKASALEKLADKCD